MIKREIAQLLFPALILPLCAVVIQGAADGRKHVTVARRVSRIGDGSAALQIDIPALFKIADCLCVQIELRDRGQVLKPKPVREADAAREKEAAPPKLVDRVWR